MVERMASHEEERPIDLTENYKRLPGQIQIFLGSKELDPENFDGGRDDLDTIRVECRGLCGGMSTCIQNVDKYFEKGGKR